MTFNLPLGSLFVRLLLVLAIHHAMELGFFFFAVFFFVCVLVSVSATVDDGLRALIRTLTNERDNTIAACTRNHRTHLGDGIEAIAYFQ